MSVLSNLRRRRRRSFLWRCQLDFLDRSRFLLRIWTAKASLIGLASHSHWMVKSDISIHFQPLAMTGWTDLGALAATGSWHLYIFFWGGWKIYSPDCKLYNPKTWSSSNSTGAGRRLVVGNDSILAYLKRGGLPQITIGWRTPTSICNQPHIDQPNAFICIWVAF